MTPRQSLELFFCVIFSIGVIIAVIVHFVVHNRAIAALLRRFPQLTDRQAGNVLFYYGQARSDSIASPAEAKRLAKSIERAVGLVDRFPVPTLSFRRALLLEDRLKPVAFDKLHSREDVELALASIHLVDKQVKLDKFRKTCLKQ